METNPTSTRLAGKVAVVTGAGSSGPGVGVGKATSVLLAREGARVVLVDLVEERAVETLRLIEQDGGEAHIVVADLADQSAPQQVIDSAVARYGTVDILVNNAAIAALVGILDTTPELFKRLMAINMVAPYLLTKAALPVMIEGGGGSIVNVVSVAAIRGTAAPQTAYAMAKSALLGMTVDIANAFGRNGIRINSIAPGHIDTPMRDGLATATGRTPGTLDFSDRTALGFEGDAWDIARAAVFLCGPDARYITGVLLPVDGGTTTRSP